MKVKMMILLFQMLAISTLKPGSAEVPRNQSIQYRRENVALRGKATQSAILRGPDSGYSHASNAIDGNRDADFAHGSCSHTSNAPNPWWRVDLLQTHTIGSVAITNALGGGSGRISGAQIRIGDSLESNGINNPQCSTVDFMGPGQTKTFYCGKLMKGRYVTVYLPKTEYLHLCEVEVNAWVPVPQ